ncbi:hypothetical protein MANES_15G124301v8 [Manihot esculenta]|uniref:Uncharacterized protein n=1 Tax=Manihot esculenta TaxID=3983 RepID=A0ACB7GB02_MANES|nr:hypothetical protein MANES_15G124301v8 [Manihot esculenta]
MSRIRSPPATYSASIRPSLPGPIKLVQVPNHNKTSPRTPFSAVAPARLMRVSRVPIRITLETIYEEENEEEFCMDMDQSFSSSILSTCFLQGQKPLSSYCQNWGVLS